MASSSDSLLDRVRPLTDPLHILATFLYVVGFVLGLYFFIVAARQGRPGVGILLAVCMFLEMSAFVWLITPAGRPNAIYLRSFRSDKDTQKLRNRLSAILGGNYRMSGIRPPRERVSTFARFSLPGILVLRYGGSKYMELEAGDDWLARLWKTYQSIHIAFLDVRDLTPYVHQEIQLTQRALGVSRCVYLIDSSHTQAEWRTLIAEISGGQAQQQELQLLDVTDDSSENVDLRLDLQKIVDHLPASPAGETVEGREFIAANVSPDLLRASSRSSRMAFLGAAIGLVASLALGQLMAAPFVPAPIRTGFLILIFGFSCLVATVAACRAFARIWRFFKEGHSGAAIKSAARLIPIFLCILLPLTLSLLVIPSLNAVVHHANSTSAIQSLKFINLEEMEYSSNYPERGFACSLATLGGDGASPTPEAAGLITPDLATGQKAGYVFGFSDCKSVTVNGKSQVISYKLYATPAEPGNPGYCTDENGEIRIDRSGGKNCTVPLD